MAAQRLAAAKRHVTALRRRAMDIERRLEGVGAVLRADAEMATAAVASVAQ